MAQLSAHALESSHVAQEAVDKAVGGAAAIESSITRLSGIREEAAATTRLMHRLAENARAIDERVISIQEVAKCTDLLALNTTIRASAGSRTGTFASASDDFGRLSDEVSQLAEMLGQATRDIGSLTRTISQDAADTVRSMEQTSTELAAGLTQTEQAGQALGAIQASSEELRKLVVDMADKTVRQSSVVRQLSQNMGVINRITRDTSIGVQANADSLNELQELATELRNGMSDFRLPVGVETKPGAPPVSAARQAAQRAVIHE
jgi:methyl-accepting chemotaxis protein